MSGTKIKESAETSEIREQSAHSRGENDARNFHCYTAALYCGGIRFVLHLIREHLQERWYIWQESLRSLRGHICTQSAIGRPSVITGPWFENHLGHRRPNRRTLSRNVYIRKLRATHPWVDSQDCQMFLMGFDAGEESSGRSADQVEEFLAENS
jgi:hypothetical protein